MRLWKRFISAAAAAAMLATAVYLPDVKAQETESVVDVKQELDAYNTVWDSVSSDSSGSMPIGNGDITANVWVGPDRDLCFYVGKSDAWSEATRLLKVGKIRVEMDPNPFESAEFTQILRLHEGEVEITAGTEGQQVKLRVWVDANNPVIRVEAEGDYDFEMKVTTEIWRDHVVTMDEDSSSASFSFNGVRYIPDGPPKESADVLKTEEDRVIWYHRNQWSYFDDVLEQQHMSHYQTEDPYLNLTFGACLKSDDLTETDGASILTPDAGKKMEFAVYPYTAQTDTIEEWEAGMDAQIAETEAQDTETARAEHQEWWKEFWNRSYIFITGDEDAETVTRGYLTQRYMQAIQGRGNYPIKFNGGTITFDYAGRNPDYRQWGPAYWFQNTRHLYWNMLASGDFEMMLPFFEMYLNALDIQKEQTKTFYGHEGAFFPETMNFTGLYIGDDFGQPTWENDTVDPENTYVQYYWQGGLELSAMMLEYYRYTGDREFVTSTLLPLAEEIVKFYDNHYERVDGKLVINPAHVLETYHSGVTNPVEVVAGLDRVLTMLLDLPEDLTTAEQREEWEDLYQALPEIPTGTDANGSYVKPAEQYDPVTSNTENPELYTVFPYKQYGVGKDDLETGINTYNRRINRATGCWTQDAIDAAYLGLAEDAKSDVTDHFSRTPSNVRFSGYWAQGNDWMPDLDNGGSGMMALQAMLMQCDNGTIEILPAWPSEWNVDAKLHAENNTVVEISYRTGEEPQVTTNPQSRQEDLVIHVPEVPEPPSEEPVAWWKLDEGTGTTAADASGNGRNATLSDPVNAVWTEGKSGSAVQLGNGAYIECGRSSLEDTDSMTISMWMKTTELNGEMYLFSGFYNGGPMVQFSYNVGGTGDVINLFSDAIGGRISSTTHVGDGQWHHVAWRYERNDSFKIFVDGKEEASAGCGTIDFSNWNWAVGTSGSGATFTGAVDDVRIYERALDPAEIEAIYAGTEEPAEEPADKALTALLQKTYDYALTLTADGVADSAVRIFEAAKSRAKAVLDKEQPSETEVTEAWSDLLEGIWGLGLEQGDKTMLGLLIDKADSMIPNQDNYVQDTWQNLVDALAEAKAVMDDGDAMEEDVQPAADALLQAILEQRLKANKSNLEDLINKADGLDLTKYTEESVSVFKAALAGAKAVMADESLSEDDQAAVDAAAVKLDSAINGLQLAAGDGGDDNTGSGDDGNTGDGSGNTGDNGSTGNSGAGNGSTSGNGSSDGNSTDGSSVNQAAKTGDNANIALIVIVLVIAAAAVVGVIAVRKIRK